jgi:peptidoglycan/xylan/chitin deacetylase (PgdA/CDA1 family)
LKINQLTSLARKKRIMIAAIAGLIMILSLIPIVITKAKAENREPPPIVIRVDDIQDFAFREAQFFLINESIVNQTPLSLAIIAGMFGQDREVVQTMKLALNSGSEAAVHGWMHEDLAKLTLEGQTMLLDQAKRQISDEFDVDPTVLIPPMYSVNEDTVSAMRKANFSILSNFAGVAEPISASKVISLPATIELSDYANSKWKMKNNGSIQEEVSRSVQKYGYAIIVTHPQEFIEDGVLNSSRTELYRFVIKILKDKYSFTTLGKLSEKQLR